MLLPDRCPMDPRCLSKLELIRVVAELGKWGASISGNRCTALTIRIVTVLSGRLCLEVDKPEVIVMLLHVLFKLAMPPL